MNLLVTGRKAINMQILILPLILRKFTHPSVAPDLLSQLQNTAHLHRAQCHNYTSTSQDLLSSLYSNF